MQASLSNRSEHCISYSVTIKPNTLFDVRQRTDSHRKINNTLTLANIILVHFGVV